MEDSKVKIIVLSGEIASGKSTLAAVLGERMSIAHIKSSTILQSRLAGGDGTRTDLVAMGDDLDADGPSWLTVPVIKAALNPLIPGVVVDSCRRVEQVQAIRRSAYTIGARVWHVHLTASEPSREFRRQTRGDGPENGGLTEAMVDSLGNIADLIIDTDACDPGDCSVRVSALIRELNVQAEPCVDVYIGAQYGSEGKGHVISQVAHEYDALIRVGGPNAGHTVIRPNGDKYAFKSLPSGSFHAQRHARIIIGSGANVRLSTLLSEIEKVNRPNHIHIDHRVRIISDADMVGEGRQIAGIGSTGQGVGAATASRILDRHAHDDFVNDEVYVCAGQIPALRPYVTDTTAMIHDLIQGGALIMLEGTQGTGLSLYHGPYPYVTSRDTTAQGTMAEAGIGPKHVRRVIMVVRANPIRVQSPEGGSSGPMKRELSWEDVSLRSGVDADVLRERERTTTTKRLRRVAEFDWELLHRSAMLNTPTDVALTFTDYIDPANARAHRFDQLSYSTKDFINEIERVVGSRVSFVVTGFTTNSVIDRREQW